MPAPKPGRLNFELEVFNFVRKAGSPSGEKFNMLYGAKPIHAKRSEENDESMAINRDFS